MGGIIYGPVAQLVERYLGMPFEKIESRAQIGRGLEFESRRVQIKNRYIHIRALKSADVRQRSWLRLNEVRE